VLLLPAELLQLVTEQLSFVFSRQGRLTGQDQVFKVLLQIRDQAAFATLGPQFGLRFLQPAVNGLKRQCFVEAAG